MSYIDAHCHLQEVANQFDYSEILKMAENKDISGWLSCALSREEIQWHQLNRSDKIKFSAGIHPIYDNGTQLTLIDIETLIKEKQIFALGEIGLDKRNRNLSKQIALLKDQISLAKVYDLPCVFHVVGHYDLFYKILSDLPTRGIWHGFSASKEIVRQFSTFDLTFSIGHVLIDSLKHTIINEIIKYGNYLIETDAPYNLRKHNSTASEVQNPLTTLVHYTNVVSRLNGVKIDSLKQDLMKNAKQYFI